MQYTKRLSQGDCPRKIIKTNFRDLWVCIFWYKSLLYTRGNFSLLSDMCDCKNIIWVCIYKGVTFTVRFIIKNCIYQLPAKSYQDGSYKALRAVLNVLAIFLIKQSQFIHFFQDGYSDLSGMFDCTNIMCVSHCV